MPEANRGPKRMSKEAQAGIGSQTGRNHAEPFAGGTAAEIWSTI